MKFGEFVAQIMRAKRLTIRGIAEKSGLSPTTVGQVLGLSEPDMRASTFQALAVGLGMTEKQLEDGWKQVPIPRRVASQALNLSPALLKAFKEIVDESAGNSDAVIESLLFHYVTLPPGQRLEIAKKFHHFKVGYGISKDPHVTEEMEEAIIVLQRPELDEHQKNLKLKGVAGLVAKFRHEGRIPLEHEDGPAHTSIATNSEGGVAGQIRDLQMTPNRKAASPKGRRSANVKAPQPKEGDKP